MSQNDIFLCSALDTNDHELPVKNFMNTFAELPCARCCIITYKKVENLKKVCVWLYWGSQLVVSKSMDTDDSSVFSFSTSAAVVVVWLESLILYIRALNDNAKILIYVVVMSDWKKYRKHKTACDTFSYCWYVIDYFMTTFFPFLIYTPLLVGALWRRFPFMSYHTALPSPE